MVMQGCKSAGGVDARCFESRTVWHSASNDQIYWNEEISQKSIIEAGRRGKVEKSSPISLLYNNKEGSARAKRTNKIKVSKSLSRKKMTRGVNTKRTGHEE